MPCCAPMRQENSLAVIGFHSSPSRRVAMKSASSAQSAAAGGKPQFLSPSPPVAQPGPDRPPMAMTTAELEAAIAALPAKKDALREAFDRLAACSPFPLPFTWGDLDAHISSLQSSISIRFRQLRVLEAARPALTVSAVVTTGDDEKGKNQEEEDASEEEEDASDEEEQEEEEEDASEEEEETSGEEVVEVEEQEAEEEEQEAKEAAAKKSSPVQDEEEAEEDNEEADEYLGEAQEEERQEAKKASPEQDIEEEEEEEEMKGEAKKVSPEQGNPTLPSGSKDLMAASASMDAPRLVELVCKSVNIRHEFPVVMRHAPDAAALVLRVVRGFLHNNEPKTAKVWGNCVGLIRCMPAVTPKLSTSMMEQAKRLAKDWKEMIDKPGSCGNLGILASWGLLYFLISYNVVSEFDADEIIRLFGTVPRKHQKNSVELCKGLGLVSRITDLIDYLIGNGQQLDAIQLTHVFNLVDKYPPLSLLEGYVEKAKDTALDIFSQKALHKSLNPAISKEVDNLRVAQNIVEQQSTDSSKRSVIFAEIKNLLAEYAKMRTLINASAASNSQQQQKTQWKQQDQKQNPHYKQQKQKEKNKKRKKEQEQQQQTKPQEKQQQQQQQQNKPQENQGQQQPKPQNRLQKQQEQNEPQERQQHLKRPRPCITKLPTPVIPAPGVLPPVVPNVAQLGPFGYSPYAVMPGVHTYPGIQGGPFSPNVGAPQYMGSFNPYQLNPLYRHPSFYPR